MYTGKQGMGKTLTMTHDILQLKYQYPSLKIGTNYGLNSEDFVIDDWRKLVDVNNGKTGVLCAIDECQIGLVRQCQRISHLECWLPSRRTVRISVLFL